MNPPRPIVRQEAGTVPSFEQLRELSMRKGIDVATTVLHRALLESPRCAAFMDGATAQGGVTAACSPPPGAMIAIVPGAFYRERPESPADGRIVREQAKRLGWATESIPIASLGSLDENARTIRDWLAERRETRIVLVSLSKGGADVKTALGLPGAATAFERVGGWVNLCGILDGTPMADWLLSSNPLAVLNRFYHRLRGQPLEFLDGLRRAAPVRPLSVRLSIPDHIRMISVVGFPLRQHLSNGIARRCHRRLTPYGPNDGCLILADVCALPGLIYPIWGADHYLRSGADMEDLISSILSFLGQELSAWQPPPRLTLAEG